jgi:hypothetical protein
MAHAQPSHAIAQTGPLERNRSTENRRRHARFAYQTRVTAVVSHSGQFTVHRCTLRDISATGARIVSTERITDGNLYLRILMEGLHEQFVRVQIVNEHVSASDRLKDRHRNLYEYGVRFREFVSDASLLNVLHSALGIRAV